MGLIKEDSCLRKIIYFVKKENIFSASNHGFTTTATEMGALKGLQGDLVTRTKLAIFSKLSIILATCTTTYILLLCPSKKKTEKPLYLIRAQISPLLQCLH